MEYIYIKNCKRIIFKKVFGKMSSKISKMVNNNWFKMGLIGGFGIGVPYFSYEMMKTIKQININVSPNTDIQVITQNKIILHLPNNNIV